MNVSSMTTFRGFFLKKDHSKDLTIQSFADVSTLGNCNSILSTAEDDGEYDWTDQQ